MVFVRRRARDRHHREQELGRVSAGSGELRPQAVTTHLSINRSKIEPTQGVSVSSHAINQRSAYRAKSAEVKAYESFIKACRGVQVKREGHVSSSAGQFPARITCEINHV